MLLLSTLWDDWPIFMISASNQQLQQELEYTLLKPGEFKICNLNAREERHVIKLCFKLGKNAMRWKLDLLLWPRDQETEFLVEACWLSQTQEGQTEQIHPQTFDYPFETAILMPNWIARNLTVLTSKLCIHSKLNYLK